MLALSVGTTMWWKSLDPEPEPNGGTAAIGDVAEFDRPLGRDIRSGGETTLAAAYAPAAAIYEEWADWSQVTPPAIGAVVPHIGIVAATRSPERADEVSLDVVSDGVVFGALDLNQGPSDCVWLRDLGLGPEVVHVLDAGDCSAAASPIRGWEPVEI
jgi:hypothetical protein